MHLFFFVRGIYQQVEVFKCLAQAQFWRWKRINLKTKQEEEILVQGSLRPSMLGAYEYVFPEECLSEVLSCFGVHQLKGHYDLLPARMAIVRKILGCDPIPKKNWEEAKTIPDSVKINNFWRGLSKLNVEGIGIYPIGIKKDLRKKWEEIGYEQEML